MPFTDTSVKWIHEGFRGAPVLSGTAGALLTCLRAFLVTGFGATVANSVVVADGVATAVLPVANGFEKYAVVSVSGCTNDAAFNVEGRISDLSGMTVKWPTTAADGTKTGTITIKYAPLGWEEVYTGTNVAVFKPTHIFSTGCFLRVADTAGVTASVVGYRSMSDVDTGSNPFPSAAIASAGSNWQKASAAGSAAIPYAMAGDALLFHFFGAFVASGVTYFNRSFGDPVPLADSDPYGCILGCNMATTAANNQPSLMGGGLLTQFISGSGGICYSGTTDAGGPFLAAPVPMTLSALGQTGTSGAVTEALSLGPVASASSGNKLILVPMLIRNGTTTALPPRSVAPGIWYSPQSGVLAAVPNRSIVNHADKRMLALGTTWSTNTGVNFVDIVGPWRDLS